MFPIEARTILFPVKTPNFTSPTHGLVVWACYRYLNEYLEQDTLLSRTNSCQFIQLNAVIYHRYVRVDRSRAGSIGYEERASFEQTTYVSVSMGLHVHHIPKSYV